MIRLIRSRWLLVIGLFCCHAVVPLANAQQNEFGVSGFAKLNAKSDWPWWRGPMRNGHAADSPAVPTTLSPTTNAKWKSAVDGRGHASPIVVGQQIFLATAEADGQVHSVIAFDRASGRRLWKTEINRGGFPAKNHPNNTEASPTIACDGEFLFAACYHHDAIHVTTLDLTGKVVWRKNAGAFRPRMYEYGYAPSPLIYGNTVIISAEFEGGSFLVAFARRDGEEAWRIQRQSNISFSSPVVAHVAGRDQLLISGTQQVASYDPRTGKSLWTAAGTATATCGTVVWNEDSVFASGGFPQSETVAIKADGSGQLIWRNNHKCYEQSMIVVDGHLYALTDAGVLFCWNAVNGKEMWKVRLRGPVSASPVMAGGNIYWANEKGTLYVFKPNPHRFELVAENTIGDESFASPAICGGNIYLRVTELIQGNRQEMLYCF